jgi:hypothetical protein
VTIGRGSKLSTFGRFAFRYCPLLESIRIPTTARQAIGLAMMDSGLRSVTVDEDDEAFQCCGNFLVDFGAMALIRYFGTESEVSIASDIEAVAAGCFGRCESFWSVEFEADCRVSILGEFAFSDCSVLQSICVPSSVQKICDECFVGCTNLSNVTFESDSRLSILGESAFHRCSSLQSICIPSSINIISKSCFRGCSSLSNLAFESVCRIAHLYEDTFSRCSSLQTIQIPASIETISPSCFADCASLVNIILPAGSKLSAQSVSDLLRSKYQVFFELNPAFDEVC